MKLTINTTSQMLVFLRRGETGVPGENLSVQSTEPTNSIPHMTPSPGIEPGPHWWEGSALTTAPSLHPDLDRPVIDLCWKDSHDVLYTAKRPSGFGYALSTACFSSAPVGRHCDQGGSPLKVRLFHCTSLGLTLAITPDVGNSSI